MPCEPLPRNVLPRHEILSNVSLCLQSTLTKPVHNVNEKIHILKKLMEQPLALPRVSTAISPRLEHISGSPYPHEFHESMFFRKELLLELSFYYHSFAGRQKMSPGVIVFFFFFLIGYLTVREIKAPSCSWAPHAGNGGFCHIESCYICI